MLCTRHMTSTPGPCQECAKEAAPAPREPDPRDARIAELEARLDGAAKAAYRHVESYLNLQEQCKTASADRDRLQAEVERLKTVACNLSSTIRILERRNATARLALERFTPDSTEWPHWPDIAREALAALTPSS